MPKPDLNEPREWTGEWWLPSEPDDRYAGVLTYAPDEGLRLRLIAGGWDHQVAHPGANGSSIFTGELKSWPIVHGRGNGEPITLRDVAVERSKGFGFRGFKGSDLLELRAHIALVGTLLEDRDQASFVSVRTTIENLTTFAQAWGSTMRIKPPGLEETDAAEDSEFATVHLREVPSQEMLVGELIARLQPRQTYPHATHNRDRTLIRVTESASVSFEAKSSRPLDEWLPLVDSMANLLTLMTMTPCATISICASLPPDPGYPAGHPMHGVPLPVEVYRRPLTIPDPDAPALDQRRFLLTLADLPFGEVISRWFELRDRFAAAIDMTAGEILLAEGFIESRVITAVAAAESMHRSLNGPPPMTSGDFKQLKAALLEVAGDEHRQWVRERVGRNEPTLRQRLVQLALRPGAFMSKLVGDAEQWAVAASSVRNTLAHAGPSGKHSSARIHAVLNVSQAVVIANLLSDLGLPEARIAQAIAEHPRLSHVAYLAAREFGSTEGALEVQTPASAAS